MNNSTITNLCIFIGICIFSYLIFRNLNTNNSSYVEGMTDSTTDASGNPAPPPGSITNGVAGNAAGYAAQLKSAVIKSQDEYNVSFSILLSLKRFALLTSPSIK